MNKIYLAELPHKVIQGEGNLIGKKMLLFRVSGCSLKCKNCFGIKPGQVKKIPYITVSGKPNKRITDIKKDDLLLTFDSKGQMVETKVIDIIQRDVSSWYEVVIEGKEYFVTPEHPFFTTKGLVEMKDLSVDDIILHAKPLDKNSFRLRHNNPMWDEEVKKKVAENTDYVECGRRTSERIKKQQEEGTYIHSTLKLSKDQLISLRKKQSECKLGDKNPMWEEDKKNPNYTQLVKDLKNTKVKFSLCFKETKPEIHHLDHNPDNDTPSNFIVICHKCHSGIHQRGFNFWKGDRKDGKTFIQNGFKINSIKYVEESKEKLKVFNLSCAPYNSYLIDNMWVHNCDSSHTWKTKQDISYTVEQFRDFINIERSKRHFDFVMITGGEPALYKDFLYNLFRVCFNFNFQVEDAGNTNWYDFRNFENVYFSFSPKIGALQDATNIKEWDVFNHLPINWICKIVVDKNDWDNNFQIIKQFQEKYCIPNEKIYLMPIGTHVNEIQEQCQFLIDKCFENNFNFSPRLHVLMFDNKRLV